MKLKTVLASLALCSSSALVAASPITFSTKLVEEGSFTQSYSFTLDTDQLLSGSLTTRSVVVAHDVTISSFVLSNGVLSYVFDSTADLTQLLLSSTSSGTETVKGTTRDIWTDSYSFDSVLLTAGDWTLTVYGSDTENKRMGSIAVALETSTVPEPQTLALSLLALGAAGLASRRKASSAKAGNPQA